MAMTPGPLCLVLKQLPPQVADGGVNATKANRGRASKSELVARATVRTRSGIPDEGFHCRRGDTLEFDASGSSPGARAYEWTFEADEVPVMEPGKFYTPETPPPGRSLEGSKSGRQVKVVALDSFTATLIVRNEQAESLPFRINVKVQPRAWKTSFVQRPGLKTFTEFYGPNSQHAGKNICSLCPVDVTSGHQIHQETGKTNWKGQFRVRLVTDPGGPFDQLWYVESLDLQIDRSMYINNELTTGKVHQLNNRKDTPPAYREGLKTRIECTTLHERLHGELVKQKLDQPGMDPAPRVEGLIGDDEDSLAEQANSEIAIKEGVLSDATLGAQGHGVLREKLRQQLKVTKVTFLLPQSKVDDKGIPIEVDLLAFED